MSVNKWTREELIIAFNLYCKIPFGKIDHGNPEIISLAKMIGRTPSAVSWKLANFARLDPSLQKRSIIGASHGSKLDIEIWNEFNSDWEKLAFESEKLLAQKIGGQVEEIADIEVFDLPKAGKERDAVIKVRVNQNFFRKAVLSAYNFKCCITGLAIPEMLNASHIVPWSKDEVNRVNPTNGLCLNVFHDRAFDRGLLTITTDLRVKVSPVVKITSKDLFAVEFLMKFDGQSIKRPKKFVPNLDFIKYHNEYIFRRE